MVAETNPEALSPRLEAVLKSLPDRGFGARLRKVYVAAAQAIARLSDIDLVQYETNTTEASADLSLWEEMAPVIRDTVMDVNALLNVIRESFPIEPQGGIADTVSRAADEAGAVRATGASAAVAERITEVLRAAMQELAQGITSLGEAMRSPSVVSDRWNLLAEIQTFRARFREQMGNLVFDSASALGEVQRSEVVPGHDAEIKAAVNVRTVVTDLARIVAARRQKVSEAEPEDVQWNAQQMQNELDAFGKTPAYRHLRAQDKRRIIEIRAEVGRLAIRPNLQKAALEAAAQELDAFVQSLAGLNRRQVLITHDREVWAACSVKLERASGQVVTEPSIAARTLADAVSLAQALYGRDAALDAFLRKVRKTPVAALPGPELKSALASFQKLLAGLPMS